MAMRQRETEGREDNTRSILRECCQHKLPATILVNHADTAMHGRFAAISDQAVTFDLFFTEELSLLPLILCCVTFWTANRSCVFLAPIQDYRESDSQTPQLIVKLPSQGVQAEARSVFRIPVWRESGLMVHLWASEEKVWKAEAVNISLAGILVKFPEEDTPDLPIGSQLRVELQLDNHFVRLAALVRRRSRQHYGLFFPECLYEGRIESPAELQTVVSLLDQTWIRRINPRSSLLDHSSDTP